MTGLRWLQACPLERLQRERGAAALFGDVQVALFRIGSDSGTDEVLAVGNVDPFSGAAVLSRGIVGDRAGVPTVASPVYKQVFDLRTGACLDDEHVALATYPVRVEGGVVTVGLP